MDKANIVEDARSPGRPSIGPRVEVRFTAEDLAEIDSARARRSETRPEYIRRAVRAMVDSGKD